MAISSSLTSAYNSSSGLNSLISQYMALERRPLTALNTQKTSLSSSLNIHSDLKSKLSDLLTLSRDLGSTETTTIYNSRTSSSGDETKITASAGSGAAVGTFQVRVKQLATGASSQSTAALLTKPATVSSSKVAPGSGTIDVTKSFANAGFGSTPTGTVTIGSWTSADLSTYTSVQTFIDAVNAAGVDANIYYNKTEDKFSLESKTATALTFSESVAGGSTGLFTQVKMRDSTTPYAYHGTADATGVLSNVILNNANFDTTLTSTTTGKIKINGVEIAYDTSTDTMDAVISRINSSTANVNVFYDTSLDKVLIKSKGTGSTDTITLSDVSGNLMNVLKLDTASATSGTDAKFTINSTSASDELAKSTNTFTINGINYTLKNTNVTAYTDTTYTTITVKQDTSALQSKINDFLKKVNDVTQYIKDKSGLDAYTKARGVFAGNTTFSSLKSQLYKKLSEQVTGLTSGNPDYLSKIGINFDSYLKTSLSDTTKFNNAISANSQAVQDLFNSTNGVAKKLETLLKPFVESTSTSRGSIIDETKSVISNRITDIETRTTRLEARLKLKENQYRQQLYKMQDLLTSAVLRGNQISSLFSYS
ncbi:MAG: flagellar filament capping protein FliD [Candidatus Brocadiaceae bacterium]|nr:flagellar filament capping protein FliD [Candidatus Brocadiaceae bacterium]